jgi:hypothetical protein
MATVELMEEEDTSRLSELIALAKAGLHGEEEEDTSMLSELIALAEAGLRAQEEDEFMSQAAEEVEATYYKQKCDETKAEDQLFSRAADEAEANYYKRNAEKCHTGQCIKWNEVVVEDCTTNDSEDELLIDCDSD